MLLLLSGCCIFNFQHYSHPLDSFSKNYFIVEGQSHRIKFQHFALFFIRVEPLYVADELGKGPFGRMQLTLGGCTRPYKESYEATASH